VSAFLLFLGLLSQPDATSADTTLQFADHLLRTGDYYRAISEFERYLFFYHDSVEADSATLGIGRALLFADQPGLLEQWFERIPTESPIRPASALLVARGAIEAGIPALAEEILEDCMPAMNEAQLAESHFLSGLTFVSEREYFYAASQFSLVPDVSPFSTRAQQYDLLLDSAPQVEPRNPTLAAFLGVVPGLGYAYSGHYGTAIASLLVNGALAWGTISAFRNDNDEAGWALCVLGAGFYMGNITGSAQSARRYNDYINERYRDQFVY
jgi:hypothetical protein